MSTDEIPGTRPLPPVITFLVLGIATLFYIGMAAAFSDMHNRGIDAFGRGLAGFYGFVFGVVLWLLLSVLLLIAGSKGAMPRSGAIAAFTLLPLSAIAAAIGADPDSHAPQWLHLVPLLLPPPIAAYAIWARLAVLHRVLTPTPTAAVLLGLVLLLTLAPVPRTVITQIREAVDARREAAADQARKTAEDARLAANRARFDKLTAASPLAEWAAFIGKDSELDQEAVAGARALAHRQADAEAALQNGIGFPLVEYGRLDLDATPTFCAAAGDFLRGDAASHPSPGGDAIAAYAVIHQNFSPYLEGIEWLTQVNCDLDDAVARLAETAATYPPSSSRDGFLGVLAWRRGNGFYKREAYDRALAAYGEAIRREPTDAQFFDSRGNVAYDQEDYDRAIADYDAAIRLDKSYSAAFDSRANAYHYKGDDERALADYDEAIRLAPDFALAFNNRGALYDAKGEHARAIVDFDAALRLAPKFRTAFSNRGRAKFYGGDDAGAATDFAAALALKPAEPYAVLWLYLARARTGQSAQDPLRVDAARLDRTAWPWPVVAAYLDDQDAATVFTTAGDAATRNGQHCEAAFYLGAKAAAAGNAASARTLLTQAAATCPRQFIEAPAARFELARLP